MRIVETVYELGQLVKGTPKSEASIRKVVFPELTVPELQRHLNMFAAAEPDGFVFVGVKGGQLRRSNFSKPWARALAKAGLPLRFTSMIFAIPGTRSPPRQALHWLS